MEALRRVLVEKPFKCERCGDFNHANIITSIELTFKWNWETVARRTAEGHQGAPITESIFLRTEFAVTGHNSGPLGCEQAPPYFSLGILIEQSKFHHWPSPVHIGYVITKSRDFLIIILRLNIIQLFRRANYFLSVVRWLSNLSLHAHVLRRFDYITVLWLPSRRTCTTIGGRC